MEAPAGSDLLDAELPLSAELLQYYRRRVLSSEQELAAMQQRIDGIESSQEELHKSKWALHKRNEEVGDLHRALSDSHVYVWEEKERCLRLQAENDELRIQEAEDRRRIQHLLSLVEPLSQDVTYVRQRPPDTLTLHPHARAKCVPSAPPSAVATARPGLSSQRPAQSSQRPAAFPIASAECAGANVAGGEPQPRAPLPRRDGGAVASTEGPAASTEGPAASAPPQPAIKPETASRTTAGQQPGGTRVLRTVYMPNEKVDTLLHTIEALRAQLQQTESLNHERVAALLEDRRLRMAEEAARRASEAEQMGDMERELAQTKSRLTQYTKDFLALKHESLRQQRADTERIEALRSENISLHECMNELQRKTESVVAATRTSAQASSEQYVSLFRQQVSDTERTLGLMTDQHHALQQALAMKVREQQETIDKLRTQLKQAQARRRLDAEGFAQELALLNKQMLRVELAVFGKRLNVHREMSADLVVGSAVDGHSKVENARSALRKMKARVAAVERAVIDEERA